MDLVKSKNLFHKINAYFILSVFCLFIFLPGINSIPVIDRDEAHFAQASRQMLQTGNFFQIRFQEVTRFQKPPGINWLQAVSVKIFSNANSAKIWPYRIPSFLSALLAVLTCFFLAQRLVPAVSAAMIAAAILGCSLLLVVEAHMAVIDAALLLTVVLMQTGLWCIYQHNGANGYERYWAWLFWLSMSVGIALKGVTPLIGGLTILALCIQDRNWRWLRRLYIGQGLILVLILTFTWVILVSVAEHSNYLVEMINRDLLPKLKGGHESHGHLPLFHLAILPITFWPGSLFLVPGILYAIRHRADQTIVFLLAWIIPNWIFFELMPTKLPQYLLPIFPALAILCALGIHHALKTTVPSIYLRILQLLWASMSILGAVALSVLSYLLIEHFSLLDLLFLVCCSVLCACSVYWAWYNRGYIACTILSGLTIIIYPLFFMVELPKIKAIWLTRTVVEYIDQSKISAAKPLLVIGFAEPSLVFNLNTSLVKFTNNTAQELMANDPTRLALVDDQTFHKWLTQGNLLTTIASVRGYNYNKGRWIELFLVKQGG